MLSLLIMLAPVPLAVDTPPHPDAKHVRAVSTTVTRVIDGDTFVISRVWAPWRYLEWDIRVRGIDTPEKGAAAKCADEKRLGLQATEYARAVIAEHDNKVRVKNVAHDKYGGRLVADVDFEDGTTLASYLITIGYARPYAGFGPKPNWCPAPAQMSGERG